MISTRSSFFRLSFASFQTSAEDAFLFAVLQGPDERNVILNCLTPVAHGAQVTVDRTIDSLAMVLGPVEFINTDTSAAAREYRVASDSAYAAHIRAELARHEKIRFMNHGRTSIGQKVSS